MLFVISAPSGAGKTTIAREILRRFPEFSFSVSATTRPRRPGERDGVDYVFLSPEEFRRRIRENRFVEWEEIFGNFYGTPVEEITRSVREGKHLLFDVDVNGALSIKRAYPERAVLIFIRPPDIATLGERLRGRGAESEETIARRIERAEWELTRAAEFDHVVVNDELDRAVAEVESLIRPYLDGVGTTGNNRTE
ncbi:MAG: guanylate kinase [Bacteroidota bacterium]|nr:guanylate kinase [Bacteroidota bacterium]